MATNTEDHGIIHSFNKFLLSTYYVSGTVLNSAYNQRNCKRLNKFGPILWHLPRVMWKVKSYCYLSVSQIHGRWKKNKAILITWVFWLLGFWITECFLVLEVTFRSIKCISKHKAEGRIKKKTCESNSAQSLSLTEIPIATLPCIPWSLAMTKFMGLSPSVISVMGCHSGGSSFC